MARDCTINRDPNAPPPPPAGPPPPGMPPMNGAGRGFDSEYANLMAELGESPGGATDLSKPSWAAGPGAGHDITGGGTNIPPWRRPEAWQTNLGPPQQGGGYRPPQGFGGPPGYGGGGGMGGQWGAGGGGGGGYGYPQQGQEQYAQYQAY